ncbi:RNA polymerase recycling motor HelD [Weissella tructae]|uniref:DNA helicase n=2 Tax=Weissella TaxID=46255 RepID=A0A075TXI0_9LACO|nr:MULTISPECIES: RNA polymerase recycling motor HelD [Weissella]AIG65006.1 DNA helicase [Weissella tructae]AIM62318.1 DNA helicase [Weissella ceti]AIM63657.1 DNA helicase [Weissella ceti]ELA07802.1 ATP-dependent DNA helicase [Weissella ceti NC36]QVV91414.1 AAA family ATPase [Weissella tructae]
MEEQEWQLERQRLVVVNEELATQLVDSELEYEKAHAETSAVERNYGANTSINTLEEDDSMETNAEIQQQRNIVARVTETENIMQKKLQTLKTLTGSPYFGRVNLVEDGYKEKLYIGLASLQGEDGDFLINDWRAPISGVYYNGVLGKVTYPTPVGEQEAFLEKKRQFTIEDGEIVNMFDTDVTIGDEMLQYTLGQQNDDTMHNIVATIQQEQNRIIRDTESDLLVVQGVAGSGKTSAILQRIAFLLFHAREELNSDQIVLFSPNRLFSSYIADVLPSLGERNMRQVTLHEFLSARLQGLQVQTLFERYEHADEVVQTARQAMTTAIEAPELYDCLVNYLSQVRPQEVRFADVYFDDEIWFSADEFKEVFASFPAAYSFVERMKMTQEVFLERLTEQYTELIHDEWVELGLDALSNQEYQALRLNQDGDLMDDEDTHAIHEEVAQRYVAERLRSVDDAVYNFAFVDVYAQYADFLVALGDMQYATLNADWWALKAERYSQQLELHKIDYEDAIPVLYLRDLMTGAGTNQYMQYIFVDEMQDYTQLQMLYLKHAFPRAKFTLLGDAEQALFRAVETPSELLGKYKTIFGDQRVSFVQLNKSYRSTTEIMDFAKALLPDGDEIVSFERHGAKPELSVLSMDDISEELATLIGDIQTRQQTVAVVTKTQQDAHIVGEALRRFEIQHQVIENEDRTRDEHVLVLPIYLAKGLEFDAVVGYDVSAENYPDDESVGLLYTLASRAMHELHLISKGPATPLLETVMSYITLK